MPKPVALRTYNITVQKYILMKFRDISGYLFVLPSLALILVFVFYPVFHGVSLSLRDVYLLSQSASGFVGLQNFKDLLSDSVIREVARNTLIWIVVVTMTCLVVGLILAITLNTKFKGKNIIQALVFMPWLLPEIVVASNWRWILDGQRGVLNYFLVDLFHLKSMPSSWLSNEGIVLIVAAMVMAWRTYPFVTMMILAGLQAIPEELYDAGQVDGASRLQSFRYITLPQLRYILTICTLIVMIWSTNAFSILFMLTGGGPMYASTTIPILIYKTAFEAFRLSKAAALSTLLFMFTLGLTVIYMRITRPIKSL